MQNIFSSKVFVESKKRNILLRALLFIVTAVILVCLLIKVLVGDFRFSDISGILVSALIIFTCKNNTVAVPRYAPAIGKIEFDKEEMTITYADVDGGKSLGRFTETTVIRYEDIECIQYGNALLCYRLVAKCLKKRYFYKFNRENIIQNNEKSTETFIYVLDEEEDVDLRKNLQKYSGCIVSIMDADIEEDE